MLPRSRRRTQLCLALLCASEAYAFSTVTVFGASYCDSGKSDLTVPPYVGGRFTNGLTWSEYLAQSWNAQLNDYAVGGAVVDPTLTPTSGSSTAAQVNTYIAALKSKQISYTANDNVLHVWVGLNSIKEYLWPGLITAKYATAALNNATIAAIQNGQSLLSQASAVAAALDATPASYTILLLPIPPTQKLPAITASKNAVPSDLASLADLTMTYNQAIYNGTLSSGNTSSQFLYWDVYNWWNAISIVNSTSLFQETTSPCLRDFEGAYCAPCTDRTLDVVCANASQYLYWDAVHPTTVVHKALASELEQYFKANGSSSARRTNPVASQAHRLSRPWSTVVMTLRTLARNLV